MKKLPLLLVLFFCSGMIFAQSKKAVTHKVKADTATANYVRVDSVRNTGANLPAGTTVIVLTPDQVKLLEYVIQESGASFKETNTLIQILRTQQYHPPITNTPKDTLASIPKVPLPKSDSTAAKK